jgi:hypothetical protein
MGFCEDKAGGKEALAFSDQAITDNKRLRMVVVIVV